MHSIKTSSIHFPVRAPAGTLQASGYLAHPEQGGPFPGLVVLQEFWGLNAHIQDVTRRLAAEGFVALAPDMYDGKVTTDPNEARQLLTALDPAEALRKMNGAVEQLNSHPLIAKDRLGVIGFCMGGFLALNLACNNKDLRVAVPFYGRIPPTSVLDKMSAPVLYFFGEQDHHLPATDVNRLEEFLKETGRIGGVVRYPQADHAFFNDTRKEVYREADAKDAWIKALAFLRQQLL